MQVFSDFLVSHMKALEGAYDMSVTICVECIHYHVQNGSHNTHFCFPQTLEAVKRLHPKRALLIGMTHEFDHHSDNAFLKEWSKSKREGVPVELESAGRTMTTAK